MALESVHIFVIQLFIAQVLASYEYIHYAGPSYPAASYVAGYAVPNYGSPAAIYPQPYTLPAPSIQPSLQPYQMPSTPPGPTNQAPAPTCLPAPIPPKSANTASPSLYQSSTYQVEAHQQPIKTSSIVPQAVAPEEHIKAPLIPPSPAKPDSPRDLSQVPQFDSNILNNLAIALQLLIVSNLIHNPPHESLLSKDLDEDIVPGIAPLPIAFVPPKNPDPPNQSYSSIPNANFLSASTFGDVGISKSMMSAYGSPTLPASRPMGLMSPYDAIGPNSPYAKSFPSKVESRSPYHLSSDYNDLFSLSELFKI